MTARSPVEGAANWLPGLGEAARPGSIRSLLPHPGTIDSHGRRTHPQHPPLSCAPYAYAAKAQQADLIFTAGACPLDGQGQVVAPGDVAGQMRQALSNLRIALAESGATLRDVLKTMSSRKQ